MLIKENYKYELYNKLCKGLKECQIAWSNQNIIAISTLIKTVDDNKKVHNIPSIHIFKEVIALDKFFDINKTITDLSNYSRIAKSSYYHKSEIVQLSWSDDGNYLASIDKDGHLCIWESKNFINEWNIWYYLEMKNPISCFTWLNTYNKFNIDPSNEFKYINKPVGSKTVNNVGFALLTSEGEVNVIIKNEEDIIQKFNTVFTEFEKNKKKNPVITHASCYLGEDNTLSYVIYCNEISSNHIITYNVSLNDNFVENPLKGKRISQLKIDSIRNVNKNYCLMDMQLMNEKKMILTFGINNASMDNEFIGYICSFELTDEMDITAGIGWESNNTTFNDFIFGNNKTWKLNSISEYKKTYPQYIKIVTNICNKHALLIQYENGTSELRDCDTLSPITYYDCIFTNNIPEMDAKLIETLTNYNKKHELEMKSRQLSSNSEETQKKLKMEKDVMDIDPTTPASLFAKEKGTINTDFNEKNPCDYDYYYYTSELILSPNGLVALTFKKTFNDIKFKITEGNSIMDLFLCWEDHDIAKKRIASKFEFGHYSEEHYQNLIKTLVSKLVVAILNGVNYEDIVYFIMKINKYFESKDLIGDFLVCFFNEYNKYVTLIDHSIISDFPKDETSSMSIEGQAFVVALTFNRSFSSRDTQYFNDNVYVQLNYIGQSFLNHFIYPWRITKYLDKPILNIDKSFEEYCAIKKECLHYNAPLACWIIELCKHLLKHLYLWYNVSYRKRNHSQILSNDDIVNEFINQPNNLPILLFANSRRMLIRLINYINLYSINLYVYYNRNTQIGPTRKKSNPDNENLTPEEENFFLSEFMNLILKNRMDLNELNTMLYEIDLKLRTFEKDHDLEFQVGQIKHFIYHGTIPSYLENFIKKDLKELFLAHLPKIFFSENLEEAYANLLAQYENTYIEQEKMSFLTRGMIYQNLVGLKLYGLTFSVKNTTKKFENINFEEPKRIHSNLTDYQINNLPNTFFSDIVELNEVNLNTPPNIYNHDSTIPKSKIISILENNLVTQYDVLTKTSLHFANGIRQCERCYHFSEIPHTDEFGGYPLSLHYNVLIDESDTPPHKKENLKNSKKIVMPSVGGENLNAGVNLYIFQGKAAWYRKYGRNCICGGRWRKW